jgi:UTP:GlnB (protein PII) uridylyltransferase
MSTKVRFVESHFGVLSLLEIESTHRRALFLRLTETLFALRVQIVRAECRVTRSSRIERLALVELDGAPIGRERRLAIQSAVLGVVDRRASRSYLTQSRRSSAAGY